VLASKSGHGQFNVNILKYFMLNMRYCQGVNIASMIEKWYSIKVNSLNKEVYT